MENWDVELEGRLVAIYYIERVREFSYTLAIFSNIYFSYSYFGNRDCDSLKIDI